MDALTLGLSVRTLAQSAGVTERTARRWKAQQQVPEPYRTALIARLSSNPGIASKAWDGWSFQGNALVSPEGRIYTPAEIRATALERQALHAYRQERSRTASETAYIRLLKSRADDLATTLQSLLGLAQEVSNLLRETPEKIERENTNSKPAQQREIRHSAASS